MRREVRVFAAAMEAKLARNEHKGGWDDASRAFLRRRLRAEMNELFDVLGELTRLEAKPSMNPRESNRHRKLCDRILGECADVANYALIVADTHGVLRDWRVAELKKKGAKRARR